MIIRLGIVLTLFFFVLFCFVFCFLFFFLLSVYLACSYARREQPRKRDNINSLDIDCKILLARGSAMYGCVVEMCELACWPASLGHSWELFANFDEDVINEQNKQNVSKWNVLTPIVLSKQKKKQKKTCLVPSELKVASFMLGLVSPDNYICKTEKSPSFRSILKGVASPWELCER